MSRYLLILFLVGSFGALAELVLLGHYEDYWQWIPVGLLALGFIIGTLDWSGLRVLLLLRVMVILYIASGMVGIYLHFLGNREFELEMYPSLEGWDLFWKTLTGATPALSPGVLLLLGGLLVIYLQTRKKS